MPRGFRIPKPKPAGWKPGKSSQPVPLPVEEPKKPKKKQPSGTRAAALRAAEQRAAAQRAAQKRRQQAEQAARIGEQRRKAVQSGRRKAAQRAAEQRLQRAQYTVKRKDTAEKIAQKLGTTAQDIAAQSPETGLKAGQVISFDVPDPGLRPYMREPDLYGRDVPGRREEVPSPRAQKILEFQQQLLGEMEVSRMGTEPGNLMAGQIDPDTGVPISPEGVPDDAFVDTQRDLDRQVLAGLQEQYGTLRDEQIMRGMRAHSAEMTWRTLSYAWNSGDMSVRPELIDPWTWSQMGPDVQAKVQRDLLYYEDEEGYQRRIDFVDEGYGMGDGEGGYGAGYGGYPYSYGGYPMPAYPAVADSEILGRTSTYRGTKTGGKSRLETGRLVAGGLPAAHWRI